MCVPNVNKCMSDHGDPDAWAAAVVAVGWAMLPGGGGRREKAPASQARGRRLAMGSRTFSYGRPSVVRA